LTSLLFRSTPRPSHRNVKLRQTVIDTKFTQSIAFNLERSYADSSAAVPIFIFLSPGVDVAASVEQLGRKLGMTAEQGKYVSVSLGQGQEPIAMNHQ
jgi:dynein heavy chain